MSMYRPMFIHYKGPVLTNSVYSGTLGPSYFAIKLQHFTRHSHQGTDIPLPGQAERMAKHVAGCEHTAHLGCLKKNWCRTYLGISITGTKGATSAPPMTRFISMFVKSQVSATSLDIMHFCLQKEVLSYRYLSR